MARRLVPLVALALVGCSMGAEGGATGRASGTATVPSSTSAPAPTPPPEGPVTLAFAGDVHTAGRLEERFSQPGTALAPVAPLLNGADLTMV
ncbi:MAG: hypothetical protein ACJ72G_09830, partial [Friedmanniella sp.]